jgi:4-aminobutyrate aminotransferase
LMIGLELVKDRDTKEPAKQLRERVIQSSFEHGLITLGSGQSAIRFAPPLNITRNLVDEGLGIFETALTEAESKRQTD